MVGRPAGTSAGLDRPRAALYHPRMMLRRLGFLLLLPGLCGGLSACRTPRRAADGTPLYPFRPGREVPPVVAVMDFENRASWAGQWNLSGGMADLLVARLMETRQVVVIERQHLGDVVGEIARQGEELFRKEGRAERGRLKNAQYLLRGTITDFTVIEESSGGFWSSFLRVFGRGSRARVAITIKVYDVENGEVMASIKSDGTVSSGGGGAEVTYKHVSFGGDSFFRTPLGKATERAIDRAAGRILAALPITYWSPRVAEAGQAGAGPAVVINGGVNVNLKVGDEFLVHDLPRRVTDPVTGNVIEASAGRVVGRIRVQVVLAQSAHAVLLQGTVQRGQVLEPVGK